MSTAEVQELQKLIEEIRLAKAESDEKLRLAKAESDEKLRLAKAESDEKLRLAKAEADEKLAKVEASKAEADEKLAKVEASKAVADEKLAKVEASKAEADEKLAKVEASSIWQYFQEGKSLPLLIKDGSKSGTSICEMQRHLPIESTKSMEFGLLNVGSIDHCKYAQTTMFQKNELHYSTESDIYPLIGTIINDIILAANLQDILSLRCDLAISELKADFWIVTINGFPVSAIEIKKPGMVDKIKKNMIYGQLYDYLLRIRSFHGLSNVIGIYTNFNEWEICWLPDSDSCALATDLNYGEVSINPLKIGARVLHKSKTFHRADGTKDLGIALYSVLKKISYNASFLAPVPLISSSRAYICAHEDTWYWKSGLKGVTELILTMPSKRSKNFYFLRDFHGGRDGRVWLACDTSGKLAVIKFLKENKEKNAEDEMKNWHALGHSSVFIIKLINRLAVVLPFGFFYNEDKKIDESWWSGHVDCTPQIKDFENILKKAKKINPHTVLSGCIQNCSEACLIHNDIEWRHVALFPSVSVASTTSSSSSATDSNLTYSFSFKYSFIDLTDMAAAESVDEAYAAMKIHQDSLTAEHSLVD